MVKLGCIYRLTCSVNKKKYIGKSVNFKSRKRNHKTKKLTCPISQAIQKYGWDAFKPEIIVDGIPKKDLGDLEDYYIDVENTLVPNGYNVYKGGGGVCFDKRRQKWRAYGPKNEYIGLYFTKEKAKQALKLYKETGERMKSDVHKRRAGTGTIIKVRERYRAEITINKKKYSKTFDTIEECEAWLKSRSNM